MSERVISPALKSVLQRVTLPIGEVISVNGVLVRCVERPPISRISVSDACSGCYFRRFNKTCPPSQCSSFGRTDGKNVWFVELDD